ncbi:hypothetical protein [Psychrobacter submarinus]|uniref:hypothetical protein n=1 Tax=Psychrobacter submarinus TaxID=154108 RepID=UPI00191AE40C|nr:hypothetical protein [Psychrobacter submarinus]
MSMSGVSVASSQSLQLEATQEAYDRAIVTLNLVLIEDTTYENAVRTKLFEIMDERNELGNYSTSDLHAMAKDIEGNVDQFLSELGAQN